MHEAWVPSLAPREAQKDKGVKQGKDRLESTQEVETCGLEG